MAVAERTIKDQSARWLAVALIPLGTLFLLVRSVEYDLALEVPVGHVIIVGGSSAMGVLLALMVGLVAHRVRDPRILALSLAFFAVSGFSVVHALLTPAVIIKFSSTGLGWTQVAGFGIGAALLALSSIDLPQRIQEVALRGRRAWYLILLTLMVISMGVAVRFPNLMVGRDDALAVGYGYAYPSSAAVWTVSIAIVALLAVAVYRYVQDFRLAHLPLQAMVVSGMLLLADGQIGLASSRVWHLSWWLYHVLIFLGFATILLGVVAQVGRGATLADSITALFARDTVEKLEKGYNDALVALVASVEARDPYTRGHSARVCLLATVIGEEMRLSPERLRILHQSALLHDVGKIGIPDTILNKPARLTEEEYGMIKAHPAKGEAVLRNISTLAPMLGGVRSHHERWDGGGYPDGLAGEAIPLEGRVIAVADVFDALTSARAYRAPWPFDRALEAIRKDAGTAFESRIVDAFVRALPRYQEQLRRLPHLAPEIPAG